jgi:Leucine-rich repeat (LRR) protein
MCRESPGGLVGFRRGFVAALVVRGRDWASTSPLERNWDANGQAIRRITALEELHIEQVWNTLIESKTLAGLRGLSLPAAGSALIESLAKSPALPSLTTLAITAQSSNGVSQRSFRAALGSKKLAALRRLQIESMSIGNQIAECLEAPHFANLEELRLRHLSIDALGVKALAHSPCLAKLRVLDLRNNPIGELGLAYLLANPALQNLEEIVLERCGLTSASARALADWEGLRSVRKLNLLGNRLRRADAELIAASPHAVNLTDFQAPLRD